MKDKIKILILAAGKGTRMNHHLPKVLVPFQGKPLVKNLLEAVLETKIDEKPVIIVGYKRELVKSELGEKYLYAIQEEQLGTGHAVLCAEEHIKNSENILVLYGDHPHISAKTIKKLAEKQLKSKNKITMATVKLPDFKDWREFFYKNFSRIIRDADGKILKSVEFKDATEKEKEVLEVNPSYFCFNTEWMLREIKKLKNNNAKQEYYLTDLVKFAMEEKEKIETIDIDPKEAFGINSRDELELLETVVV